MSSICIGVPRIPDAWDPQDSPRIDAVGAVVRRIPDGIPRTVPGQTRLGLLSRGSLMGSPGQSQDRHGWGCCPEDP